MIFSQQIASLLCKVAVKLKAFRRVRHLFTSGARRYVSFFNLCFIQSVLEYECNAYVHSLLKHEYDQLIQLSKRAQRIVFGFPSGVHTEPIRKRFQLRSLDARLNFKLFILVFRCVNNLASTLLQNMFNLRCTVTHSSRVTRSQASSGIALPSVHSRTGCYSLSFLATDRWNSLLASLRCISSTLFRYQGIL